jgi:hypothetical protein
LKDGSQVTVPVLASITLAPASESEYEILVELVAEAVYVIGGEPWQIVELAPRAKMGIPTIVIV